MDKKVSSTPQKLSYYLLWSLPPPPPYQPLATTDHYSFVFLKCLVNRNTKHVAICNWLLSLGIML